MTRHDRHVATPSPDLLSTAGMDVRVGVDRVELAEFKRVMETGGGPFLDSVFTGRELAHCGGRLDRLAARFAAKEAATKALGTGIRGLSLSEIEVVSHASGQPELRLVGRASDRAAELGVTSISVSLTHTSSTAEAFVVALVNSNTLNSTTHKETSV
jgi:holo-[acyl-carrier protein] synthase